MGKKKKQKKKKLHLKPEAKKLSPKKLNPSKKQDKKINTKLPDDILKDAISRVQELERRIQIKDDYIIHLEKLSDAYSHLEEMTREELLEADKTIKAHETVQELMSKEKREAEETIKAHERLQDLMAREKRDADQIIRAQEQVQELMSKEKRDADETIKAHETVESLAIQEKREAQDLIRAQEQLNSLSVEELMNKDFALRNILEVNKYISSFLDEDVLLNKILKSLVSSLHAMRGILFIEENGTILPKIFYKIEKSDLNKKSFEFPAKVIDETIQTRKSRLIVNHSTGTGKSRTNLSLITVPMVYESNLFGVLYVDIISKTDTFKNLDLDLAEIFSSQAAISIHNALMYMKIKKQNDELLRLNNLKNQFVRHVSDELKEPVESVQKIWDKIQSHQQMSDEERTRLFKSMKTKMGKISHTVNKVITLISLEQEVDDLFADAINFTGLMDDIIKKHQSEIKERNLTIKLNLPEEMNNYRANLTIMKTIFDELISNAVYYNKPNGKIEIRGYRKGDQLAIDIIDSGYGVKPEETENIFLQFYRSEDSPSHNEWGAGLGLYMVKCFIAHYQGDVSVHSEYGKGSVFTVSFLIH